MSNAITDNGRRPFIRARMIGLTLAPKTKSFLFVPALSLMLGSSLSQPAVADAPVQVAEAQTVAGCRVLVAVEGSSGYGKTRAWKSAATASALKQAKTLGATHLVWTRFETVGAFNGRAIGQTYVCTAER